MTNLEKYLVEAVISYLYDDGKLGYTLIAFSLLITYFMVVDIVFFNPVCFTEFHKVILGL